MRVAVAVAVSVCLPSILLRQSRALLLNAGLGHDRRETSMSSAGSITATPAVAGEGDTSRYYWGKSRPGVPKKFLESIRTEPWRGVFEPCANHPLTEVQVEGKLPRGLEGTLFRNGCGRNRDGDRAYGHWFDGDGHISKIVFKDGRVYAQNRFVDSDSWDSSAPEGRGSARIPRAWTPRPGGWLKNVFKLPGNVRNTSVMIMGGKLYALCEAGKPVEIDPLTLETLQENDLGGIQAFYSAHPTTDPVTGETFGIAVGGKNGALEITRLSPDGTLDKSALFDPPTMTFWHDNALTDKYVVAVSSPFVASTARIFKALLGFSTIGLAFKWDENVKPEVLFFARDTLELVKRVELPGAVSSYHLVNAFQEEGKEDTVTVLVCQLRGDREELEATFRDIMGRRFTDDNLCDTFKYEIDMKTGALLSHGPATPVEGALPMELPTIDPRYVTKRNRFVYTNSKLGDAGFSNSVQRCDLQANGGTAWQTHDFGESRYAGEPVFVPRSEDAPEGDGYILVHVYIEVLDAQKLDEPPLCVAHVPWHMGTSFHGIFTRETYFAPSTLS